jgi:hypothetical protein
MPIVALVAAVALGVALAPAAGFFLRVFGLILILAALAAVLG